MRVMRCLPRGERLPFVFRKCIDAFLRPPRRITGLVQGHVFEAQKYFFLSNRVLERELLATTWKPTDFSVLKSFWKLLLLSIVI